MSYFDDASLVMIPSGYKDQKVYSVKPLDGSGDLTFSRASGATRVASNGLIEKVRTNFALQSEGFNTASWIAANTTITANAGVAPNGTTTADKIVPTTTGTSRWVEQARSITSSIPYTNSFYIKADGFSWVNVFHIDGNLGAYFNVSNGTIGTVSSGVSASIVSVGSGWYRCIVTKTSGGSTGYIVVQLVDADGSTTATASGTNGVLVWGAQIETGDIATDYIVTTSAAVSVGPVSGLPRLDYLGSTCPRLLLEPQRTNLMLYSEQFDNATWIKTSGVTISANSTISPDGYQNADTITWNGSNREVAQIAAVANGVFSFYAKGSGTIYVGIAGGTQSQVIYTLTTDWSRIEVPYTGTSSYAYIGNYGGATATSLSVWGAQLEVGAYATSYIPTLGSSVTRVADACSKTGISSLIGQTEGTIFLDFELQTPAGNDYVIGQIYNSSSPANSIYIYVTSSNFLEAFVDNSGNQARIIPNLASAQGRHKVAIAYKANEFRYYLDGVLIGTDTSGTVPTCDSVGLINYANGGGYFEKSSINQYLIFKTALTNAQLAELTTL